MTPPISTPDREGVYQGSKWLKFPVLCEAEELLPLLEPFSIFPLTGISSGEPIEKELFLKSVQNWIEELKRGEVPSDRELRRVLAAAFVTDPGKTLWLQEIPGKGYLVKIKAPVVQVQAHFFTYSREERVLHSMSMGEKSIFWGLQFSYPQIYQEGKTLELREVKKEPVLEHVRSWVREMTRPTPFWGDGQKIINSIRLGKRCFSWIKNHPQLLEQGIAVQEFSHDA